jgi:hypothetical protein
MLITAFITKNEIIVSIIFYEALFSLEEREKQQALAALARLGYTVTLSPVA